MPTQWVPALLQRRRFRVIHWLFIAVAAMGAVVTAEVGSLFFWSEEASDLRASFVESTDLKLQTNVQFSVGPGLLSLGQFATRFIDDIPAEAREALSAVRRTSVGVYEWDRVPSESERLKLIQAADARLNSEEWSRIVRVQAGEQIVMVFMPWDERSTREIEIWIIGCEGRDLVIVSATIATAGRLKLAQQQSRGWAHFLRET